MVNEKDIAKGISGILIVLLMIGSLSPYLFPDRRRTITVIQYISIPHDYINMNVTILNDFEVNINKNFSEPSGQYNINYDIFNNYNTTDTSNTFAYSSITTCYQSIHIPQNGTLNSIFGYFKSAATSGNLNFSIYNAIYSGNNYIPNTFVTNLSLIPFLGNKYFTANWSGLSINLNTDNTEGNIYFLKLWCTAGTVQYIYNTTYQNSITYRKVGSGGALTLMNRDFKINYSLTLNSSSDYLVESDIASLTLLQIGGENRTTTALGTNSKFRIVNLYNLTNNQINGMNTYQTFVVNDSIPLNILKIEGTVESLTTLFYSLSYLTTLFNGTEQYIFEANNTYNIELLSLDIYLWNPITQFYVRTWNSTLSLNCEINNIPLKIEYINPTFDYLF